VSTRVLGHLTEVGDRVIGYVLETVAVRPAGIEDLEDCRAALQKLHERGIAHGRLSPSPFLILENGSGALLQAFHNSFETLDQELLAREMAEVEKVLRLSLPEERL
jgi:hypothetical protein